MTIGGRRRILITGATGFLGKALCRSLDAEGHAEVVGCSRRVPVNGPPDLIAADLTQRSQVRSLLETVRPDVVFHLAGVSTRSACEQNPDACQQINVGGTLHLLEALEEQGRPVSVIYASTVTLYESSDAPLDESSSTKLDGAYPASKRLAEDLVLRSWQWVRGSVARLANVYGPEDRDPSRLIPGAVFAAISSEPFTLRADPLVRRDWLYVDDAVRALIAIASLTEDNSSGREIFNVSTEQSWTLAEVIHIVDGVADECRSGVRKSSSVPVAPGPALYRADKIRERCGWQAKWTLEEGIRNIVRSRFEEWTTEDPTQ